MYSRIKKNIKLLLSDSFLKKNERLLRWGISFLYIGSNYKCNICNARLRKFIKLKNEDLLCPRCGSRARTRKLYKHLSDQNLLNGKVLHFSPPRCLYDKFKSLPIVKYYPSDFENEFTADYHFDITKIDLPTNSIDLIICYHILEHISDDKKAISELRRVLKKQGTALIQTPFKQGEIYEDFSIVSAKDRKVAFGQEDHVRIYSEKGLEKRLNNGGFKVQNLKIHFENNNINGFRNDTILSAHF